MRSTCRAPMNKAFQLKMTRLFCFNRAKKRIDGEDVYGNKVFCMFGRPMDRPRYSGNIGLDFVFLLLQFIAVLQFGGKRCLLATRFFHDIICTDFKFKIIPI